MKYKLMMIDFDGTICATREAIIHSIQQTYLRNKKDLPTYESINQAIGLGLSLEETFKYLSLELFQNFSKANMDQWIKAYRLLYAREGQSKIYLFKNVKKTLQLLFDAGVVVIIVSNKGKRAIDDALDRFSIKKFAYLTIGDSVDVPKKPHPAIFTDIIQPEFSSIRPHEVLMVGDTVADISFSKNAGIVSCWAAYGYGHWERCNQLQPDITISDFGDLQSLL